METYEKRGYLHDEYRIFHLKDSEKKSLRLPLSRLL